MLGKIGNPWYRLTDHPNEAASGGGRGRHGRDDEGTHRHLHPGGADAAHARLPQRGLELPRRRKRGGAFGAAGPQIVAGHVKRCEPVDEDAHAALQVERLSFAVKIAGEALAKGDIRRSPRSSRRSTGSTPIRRAPARPRHRRGRESPTRSSSKSLVDRIGAESRPRSRRRPEQPGRAAETALRLSLPHRRPIQTSPIAARDPFPSKLGKSLPPAKTRGGPRAGWSVAPASTQPDCATVTARRIPAFRTPSGLRPPSLLRGEGEACAAAAPPAILAEPAPPLAGPESPLDIAASTAVEAQLTPPAPAPVATPFARPNMSNFAYSNFSPFFRG